MNFTSLCICQLHKRVQNGSIKSKFEGMLQLKVHLRFHLMEPLNMHGKVKKKMHVMLQLVIHLTVQ